jgi:hypothetical protein
MTDMVTLATTAEKLVPYPALSSAFNNDYHRVS